MSDVIPGPSPVLLAALPLIEDSGKRDADGKTIWKLTYAALPPPVREATRPTLTDDQEFLSIALERRRLDRREAVAQKRAAEEITQIDAEIAQLQGLVDDATALVAIVPLDAA